VGYQDFRADGVTLLSQLTPTQLDGSLSTGDCWGYTSPSGREYAIACTYLGTVFVEVTDPISPVVVGVIDGPDSTWRDAKVYESWCYVVSEGGGGIQVVDMSHIDSGNVTLIGTVDTPGTSSTHNMLIDETSGFLYRMGAASGGSAFASTTCPIRPTRAGWRLGTTGKSTTRTS